MLIEGVGDEVLVVLTLVISLFVVVMVVAVSRDTQSTSVPPPATRAPYDRAEDCPICLREIQYACETNCGHVFCSRCILEYWRRVRVVSSIACPICRQQVTAVYSRFARNIDPSQREAREYAEELRAYNRRFSGTPRSLFQQIRDVPILIQWMADELVNGRGLYYVFSLRTICYLIFSLLYGVSPVDMIPEALFGIFGLADDFLLYAVIAIYATTIFRQRLAEG